MRIAKLGSLKIRPSITGNKILNLLQVAEGRPKDEDFEQSMWQYVAPFNFNELSRCMFALWTFPGLRCNIHVNVMIQWPCFRDMSSDLYVVQVLSLPNAAPKEVAWYDKTRFQRSHQLEECKEGIIMPTQDNFQDNHQITDDSARIDPLQTATIMNPRCFQMLPLTTLISAPLLARIWGFTGFLRRCCEMVYYIYVFRTKEPARKHEWLLYDDIWQYEEISLLDLLES